MSWRVVAERDVRDPFRSLSALVLFGLFGLLFAAAGYLGSSGGGGVAPLLASVASAIVPLAGYGICYGVVAGKRQDGSLRVFLSLPHSRRDVVLGSAIGRAVVLALAVTVGFLLALLVFVAAGGSGFDPSAFLGTWALACLFAVTVVGVGVGISAAARTTGRAVAGVAFAYVLFVAAWNWIPSLVRYVAAGFRFPTGPTPTWATAFTYCNPERAYSVLTTAVVGGPSPPTTAAYTTPGFALAVLVAWAVAPLALGYLAFERGDL
ncbi:ABC transporter permease subunit [Halarchaeum sp. P4]|uniref:ABC transporter permease subunit n=1 Tax=Halarchaeum sp. P4 TaxID=3421639 RepID=UPI003EBD81D6